MRFSVLVTPDLDKEKIKVANQLIGEKKAYPWKFDPENYNELTGLQGYLFY